MTHHLSIDLETYCEEDIGKTGLYRYVQHHTFEILLLAYSMDGGPVKVIDFTQGETLPLDAAVALFSPHVVKHAYNAAFEWYCLSRFFGAELPLDQWRDTMLHGLYCGYPAGLDAAGKALGLPQDKQKMAAGKALIRYFCKPCKPSKANGGRTRNLPRHDPDKWSLFKEYNAQDVVTEMEIERRLSTLPVPDFVQNQWETDQRINARGVAVDMTLVHGALQIDLDLRRELVAEAVELTGLDNPNSRVQMLRWLQEDTGEEIADLRKATVSDLLDKELPEGNARRVLEIRQELGKTSNKKYTAFAAAVCKDERVRGLLQFYGAGRTGRWAGRLIQPQNLPRTYIDGDLLPMARELVRQQNKEGLGAIFGSVSDTLSQLIRTGFVASPGHLLVDADFSAIEARVIAWLADEEWVLEVFRTHGKIYEATASQMFGVPIDKIRKGSPEYALRQRGKVATLALGYQGGAGSLVSMGALKMGIPEEDLPDIVDRWRNANPGIVQLWSTVEAAARAAIEGHRVAIQGGRLVFAPVLTEERTYLTIQLPSGRKLYYPDMRMGTNRFGRPSLCYQGQGQNTKKWEQLETYGGKLTENIVQATARDCLAEAIERLEAEGYRVVFHVHDEVVIDAPEDQADLDEVVRILRQTPSWAEGLPLNAEGWVNPFFKKD